MSIWVAPTAAETQRIVGHAGSSSCSSFNTALELGQSDDGARIVVTAALNWTFGFLSASHDAHLANQQINGDLLRDASEDAVIEWLRSDCAKRPAQTIQQAARRFIVTVFVSRTRARHPAQLPQ